MTKLICPICLSERLKGFRCSECGVDVRDVKNDPFALQPNTVLRKQFVIGKALGAGGFGVTYLVLDRMLKRKVAIKEYFPKKIAGRAPDGRQVVPIRPDDSASYNAGLQKFLEEAQTIAKFHHSNIVPILFFFRDNGTAYYGMPFIQGKTLAEMVVQGRGISEEEMIRVMCPVLDGLSELHSNNFLHRDIKPANIYIPDTGPPILLDFGAARQAVMSHDSMSVFLTHGYAPYEQYSISGRQGPFTDIYGCAATMYGCLRAEIHGKKITPPVSAADRANGALLPALADVASSSVQPHIAQAIMRGMEMRPDDRPQSALQFKEMLTGGIEMPVAAEPSGPPRYEVVCLAGEFEGERIQLDERPLVIGRDGLQSSLVVSAKTVSKRHCRLSVQDGNVVVEDLGSRNGTFLNDVTRLEPHMPVVVKAGDMINLTGQLVLEIVRQVGPRVERADVDSEEVQPETTTRMTDELGGARRGNPVGRFFRQLFRVKGRLNRAKYIATFVLGGIIANIAMALGAGQAETMDGEIYLFMGLAVYFACIVVVICAAIRRFHDVDRSGHTYWFMLVPLANIYFALLLLFQRGDDGPNKYGPDPINMKYLDL